MDDNNNSNLWAILYVSSAMKNLSVSDVEYFLTANRRVRQENKITGIAILAMNNVLVVQEGTKEIVKAEFDNEKKHPAHHSLIKLYDGPISHRYFEDFPLAFMPIGISEYKHLDSFSETGHKEYFDEFLQGDNPVSKLVKDFIKNNT